MLSNLVEYRHVGQKAVRFYSRRTLLTLVLGFAVSAAGAQDFQKGTEALLYNKPQEAAVYLERVIQSEPTNMQAYQYLGLAYEQLAQYDKAVVVLRSALARTSDKKADFLVQIGNNYRRAGNHSAAIETYTQALQLQSNSLNALLNRANAFVQTNKLDEAILDYENFLTQAPEHPKAPDVVRMIAAIRQQKEVQRIQAEEAEKKRIVAEQEAERQRLAEEERKKREEELRRQQEEQRRLEEERKQKLLQDLLNSLNDTSNDPSALSTDNEGAREGKDDFTRED